jgi:nitrite reductase/ring-hydroxylating ferredoxin subunit
VATLLCLTRDVPLNGSLRISLGAKGALAVFNIDGRFFVTDDRCTHGGAFLSRGDIVGRQVFCPLHLGSFDIETGDPVEPPCTVRLKTYTAKVEGDHLYLVEA